MAGRESRGRLPAPSFLIVSTALACGQTTEGGGLSMNPPPQTGGSWPFGGNGGAGVGGCPETTPISGSDCAEPTSQCLYDLDAGPCNQLSASCVEGRWQVRMWEVDGCTDGAAGAPATLPPGLSADPITMMCGPSKCESTPVARGVAYVDPCCTVTDACGRSTGFLEASGARLTQHCQPLGQPGQLDTSCPDFSELRFTYDSAIVQLDPLPGCCRDDGKCGVLVDNLTSVAGKLPVSRMGLGCVDSSDFFGQPAPACGAAGAPSDGGSGGVGGAEN